jgi:hypothetical protein
MQTQQLSQQQHGQHFGHGSQQQVESACGSYSQSELGNTAVATTSTNMDC